MTRYARITEKMPREFVLLQGTGCRWKKCAFCDYHLDVSGDPFGVNRVTLDKVTGEFGILDVINSGSCTELDDGTLAYIRSTAQSKAIRRLWFEAHWMYREKLRAFAGQFPGIDVKFRTGIETFDAKVRALWDKGIPPEVTADAAAAFFSGICLLVGVRGQTRKSISNDIETAAERFEYFSVNVFNENTTAIRADRALIRWFMDEWYGRLTKMPNAEVLINNTDLGVG